MDKETILEKICNALVGLEEGSLINNVKEALDMNIDPSEIIDKGIVKGLGIVGEKFASGEFFLVELVGAAEPAQKVVKELLEPEMKKKEEKAKGKGKVVIGTVEGDIHSIGKNIVATLLFASGFEVIDLGEDVSAERFVSTAKEEDADLIGASAMLTTTIQGQKEIVEKLKAGGMNTRVKTIFGGSPCTPEWVNEIGADGYAENAVKGVELAHMLLGLKK
jgi:corrinoid protein of di/trimethylamine methyltransferase